MAKFNTGQSFADGDQVTGAKLNNIVGLLDIYSGVIADQTAIAATVSTADLLLIADTDAGSSGAANKVTVQKLLNDTLTNGTYTNAQLSGNLNVAQLSTLGTISSTNGTIGILNSTTGTITGLNTTTGTIATLNSTTGTITGLNSTNGTIATINSTTGTIPTLTSITKITSGTGTAAAPAISPTGDTNTGVFFPAADTIAFSEGGTEAMRIDSSGNVGIGTSSPTTKLDVNGSVRVGSGSDFQFDSTLKMNAEFTGGSGFIRFFTNTTERLRIASAGQIGIGGANYGTSGQVLTSAGTAAAPSWTNVAVADGSVTPAKLSQPLTLATAVTTTSGTAIDFTSVPSWVKRITVMFNAVSTSGVSPFEIQIGSGGIDSTGYASGAFTPNTINTGSTTGFILTGANYASAAYGGSVTLLLQNSASYIWVSSGVISDTVSPGGNGGGNSSGGVKTLSGVLDRIRITTTGGANTFDGGSINIMYE